MQGYLCSLWGNNGLRCDATFIQATQDYANNIIPSPPAWETVQSGHKTDIKGKRFDSNSWNIRPISVAQLSLHCREACFKKSRSIGSSEVHWCLLFKKCDLYASCISKFTLVCYVVEDKLRTKSRRDFFVLLYKLFTVQNIHHKQLCLN